MRCGLRGGGVGEEKEAEWKVSLLFVICYLDERGGTRGGRALFNELIIARCLEPRWWAVTQGHLWTHINVAIATDLSLLEETERRAIMGRINQTNRVQ